MRNTFGPYLATAISGLGRRPGLSTWCPLSHRDARPVTLENILADFQLLDDWEDRYRYVIELGRALPPLPEAARTEANRVRGCASQVWLATEVNGATDGAAPRLIFKGDSDAHIVRGLIAILFAIYSGRCADEILRTDAQGVFRRLGLAEHLTPQRSNGFASMVERIYTDSRRAVSGEARRSEPRIAPTNNDPVSLCNFSRTSS
jgi:cysteine desulfuration protein SufE